MRSLVPAFASQIRTEHRELSALRRVAADWLAERLDQGNAEAVGDASVVITELAANVIDHTDASVVDLDVSLQEGFIVITVGHDGPASAIPPLDTWDDCAQGSRGRGLRLVQALCDHVEVAGDDDRTSVSCRYLIR